MPTKMWRTFNPTRSLDPSLLKPIWSTFTMLGTQINPDQQRINEAPDP